MRNLFILLTHLFATLFRLAQPGGVRTVIAESVLVKHQLLILNRSRRRAPNLQIWDRLTSTFLSFHHALVERKYRLLFSPKRPTKPGPKGPSTELISAVIDMKTRNPSWGCPQIADQINL